MPNDSRLCALARVCLWFCLKGLALAFMVFWGVLFGLAQLEPKSRAQPMVATISPASRAELGAAVVPEHLANEIRAALAAMDDAGLRRAYAQIAATFRANLDAEDLAVVLTLTDYAALAEAELGRRGLAVPEGFPTAAEMRLLLELTL